MSKNFKKTDEKTVRIAHDNDCNTVEKEATIQRLSRECKTSFKKTLAEEIVFLSHY